MKRVGNIYPKIYDINNCREAILCASKRKKNRQNVARIIDKLDYYSQVLSDLLKEQKIELSPYRKMIIHDGVNKKERILHKPRFFPDQCIHWALMLQIQPILQRGMVENCCASVPGRGIHYGAKYIKRILKDDHKNTKYCVKYDIHHFYQSIDKDILKRKFRRIIKDPQVLWLVDLIIDSSPDEGLPIGNFTSQWFANFFLQDTDHYIKEELKIKYYLRYMDDGIILGRNKKELRKKFVQLTEYLSKENLTIKSNWQLFKVQTRPLDFLGYRFYRGYTTLRRGNFLRIKRRVKKIVKRGYIRVTDACAMISYHGWLTHADSYNYYTKYIKPYNLTLKKCKGVIKNGRSKLKQ